MLESAFWFFWGTNPYIVNFFSFAVVTQKIWTCVCLMQCVTLQTLDVIFLVVDFSWCWRDCGLVFGALIISAERAMIVSKRLFLQ